MVIVAAFGERRDLCSIRCLCGGQLAVGAQLWCRVFWWTLFAGSWWLVELLQSLVERISEILTSIDVDGDGASL